MEDTFLTETEVKDIFRIRQDCSAKQIWRMINETKVIPRPATKVGLNKLWLKSDVDNWIAGIREKAKPRKKKTLADLWKR